MSSAGSEGTGTPAAGSEGAWTATAGFDSETLGHVQNRGWDKLKPAEAAAAAIKAHREAEKHIGIPADQILRLPKDANDVEGWKTLRTKLGAPADASGYDFTGLKTKAGADLNPDFVKSFADAAAARGLSKTDARELLQSITGINEAQSAAADAAKAAKLTEQKVKLKENWGQNEAINMNVARNAAAKLGVTPEEVAALENVVGYARVMEMFRTVGAKVSEDSWNSSTDNSGGAGNKPMTVDAANARIAELKADTEWTKKYLSGDSAAVNEMKNLLIIKTGSTE